MSKNEIAHGIWSRMTYVQRMQWLQMSGHAGDQSTQTRAWTQLSQKIKRALISYAQEYAKTHKNPIDRPTASRLVKSAQRWLATYKRTGTMFHKGVAYGLALAARLEMHESDMGHKTLPRTVERIARSKSKF